MKGELEQPQCGFSRAVVTVLDHIGVPDDKIKSYNVLVDPQLREGIKEYSCVATFCSSRYARPTRRCMRGAETQYLYMLESVAALRAVGY